LPTYLDRLQKLNEVHSAILVLVKVFKQLFGFFLRQIEPKVDKTPSEILNVQVAIAVTIHRLEDFSEVFYASRGPIQDFALQFLQEILDVEPLKDFDRRCKRLTWGSKYREDVLFKLELSRNIDGDVSLLLKRQVLCFVIQAEVIDHSFVFIAEIRFVNVGIGGQELLRMTVSDQN
jgi:hypothetical protein